jgi:radical SAM superfamily enzyme YgiQ (UPF0313 family)
VSFFSSFGCPDDCAYCCSPFVTGRRWKALRADLLLDRIQEIHERSPFEVLRYQDANFGVDERRTKAFSKGLLDRGIRIHWNAYFEVEQLCRYSEETLDLMRDSGCHLCLVGGETATAETMKSIQKNIKEGQSIRCGERLAARGIKGGYCYIIGYPDEPAASMYATIDEAREIKVRWPIHSAEVFPFRPIPGTEFWKSALESGYQPPADFEGWGRFFDYKFNSWMGLIPPDVQKAWWRFTYLSPWYDGQVRGGGLLHRLLRASATARLRRGFYAVPIEFKAYDLVRRAVGGEAAVEA